MPLTFGLQLRALRLRYAYVPKWDGFIRISDLPAGLWQVELVPCDISQLKPGTSREYRRLDDPARLIAASPALRDIKRIKQPRTLTLDDRGRLAKQTKKG